MTGCTFPSCERPHKAKGLCRGHYRQQQRGYTLAPIREEGGRPPVDADRRFWSYVRKTDDCWFWEGSVCRNYGQFSLSHTKTVKAHRYAYGPTEKHLHHLCHNKLCVRPSHLQEVERGEHTRLHAALRR